MDIHLHIPPLVLWIIGVAVGVPVVGVVGVLAYVGATVIWAFRDGFR